MFSRLVYELLRLISWAGVSVFYRRTVIGREHLRFKGPAIVVTNHPSTLMDPLNAGVYIPRVMFFLANYSLFKNPISNWILSRLYCIPVKRKEDVAEGEARDNDAAFEASFKHLEKGGLLYIAAEGVSWMNRFVRPFKTGTARIAFGTERRNNWQLGVKILPVGLSYDAPNLFRSRVTVEYGAPMEVRDWMEAEQKDHEAAVDRFTLEIQERVSSLTVDSGSEAGDVFVHQVEAFIRHSGDTAIQRSPAKQYQRLKAFIAKNRGNEPLKSEFAAYFDALQKAGLKIAGFSPLHWSVFIMLPLGLPFFLLGYVFWFLPCWLPWLLAKRLHLYIGYDSNVKMLAGLLTFSLALWGGWEIAYGVSKSNPMAWGIVLILIGLAFHSERYMEIAGQFKAWRAVRLFKRQQSDAWSALEEKRLALLSACLGKSEVSKPS